MKGKKTGIKFNTKDFGLGLAEHVIELYNESGYHHTALINAAVNILFTTLIEHYHCYECRQTLVADLSKRLLIDVENREDESGCPTCGFRVNKFVSVDDIKKRCQ